MPKLPESVSEAGYKSRLSIYNQAEANMDKKKFENYLYEIAIITCSVF